MSISLEALFTIIININDIYFSIFIYAIKLIKVYTECPPWRLTKSWYDWPSVLAIVLILVVCPTKLHKKQPKFHAIQKDKPDGNNLSWKTFFYNKIFRTLK